MGALGVNCISEGGKFSKPIEIVEEVTLAKRSGKEDGARNFPVEMVNLMLRNEVISKIILGNDSIGNCHKVLTNWLAPAPDSDTPILPLPTKLVVYWKTTDGDRLAKVTVGVINVIPAPANWRVTGNEGAFVDITTAGSERIPTVTSSLYTNSSWTVIL